MATYYISPTGNDSTGTGTAIAPWATISKAYSSSANGDTINCLAGTYTTWTNQVFTTARNIVGVSGPAATIFDGAGASNFFWDAAGCILTSTGITFQNAIAGVASTPLFIGDTGGTMTFVNCVFNALQTGVSGILGNYGSGVINTTGCLFLNTTAAPNQFGIFHMTGVGPSSALTSNATACTIYTNIGAGVTCPVCYIQSGAMTANFTNCIAYNANGTSRSFCGNGTPTYGGTNNDFFDWLSPPSLPNQLSTDPLFVDAASNNFNLRPTSPCIGAGTMI